MLFYVLREIKTDLLLFTARLLRDQTQIFQSVSRICEDRSNRPACLKTLTITARCHPFLNRTLANRAKAVTVYGLDSVNTAVVRLPSIHKSLCITSQ